MVGGSKFKNSLIGIKKNEDVVAQCGCYVVCTVRVCVVASIKKCVYVAAEYGYNEIM